MELSRRLVRYAVAVPQLSLLAAPPCVYEAVCIECYTVLEAQGYLYDEDAIEAGDEARATTSFARGEFSPRGVARNSPRRCLVDRSVNLFKGC